MPPAIERDAFERLYQEYGGVVVRRARRLLGDEAAARDVCQDVFVEILRMHPAWAPTSPMAWLYAATTNRCLNVIRQRRRAERLLARGPRPELSAPPGLPIAIVLGGLPEHLQEIAAYYGVDGMKQEEIAALLGISQKTVSNRIQEIRAHLAGADGDCTAEAT